MNSRAVLENHISLCEGMYQLLLEENSFLRQTGEALPSELFEKKKNQTNAFKASVETLKALEKAPGDLKLSLDGAQKKTMKILHLLRENEQLMLNAQQQKQPQNTVTPAVQKTQIPATIAAPAANNAQSAAAAAGGTGPIDWWSQKIKPKTIFANY